MTGPKTGIMSVALRDQTPDFVANEASRCRSQFRIASVYKLKAAHG